MSQPQYPYPPGEPPWSYSPPQPKIYRGKAVFCWLVLAIMLMLAGFLAFRIPSVSVPIVGSASCGENSLHLARMDVAATQQQAEFNIGADSGTTVDPATGITVPADTGIATSVADSMIQSCHNAGQNNVNNAGGVLIIGLIAASILYRVERRVRYAA